jgi:hypothetical protein
MQPCEIVAAVTALACSISKCCSQEEITLMAAIFTQIGDTLTTILTAEEFHQKDVDQ